jgi:heme-degrading monooxygenase HmoA
MLPIRIASRCADTAASNARSPRIVSPHTNKKCYDEPYWRWCALSLRRTPSSRCLHIRLDPSETENAVGVWKTECAPLMIQQKGCMSEKLLRCKDAPEFISYSEWESEAAIEAYRNSQAHQEIVRHARALKGAKAEVKLYDVVQ